jgi:large subunit ribosomal protein L5
MKKLKEKYIEDVILTMKEKFGYKDIMAVPKLSKVVVNVGIGKYIKENDKVEEVVQGIIDITGQKPVKTKAKKAISGFKTREGLEVGVKVTLRGKRMWQFIERLINVALPRTRDFQGIDEKSVDSKGNLNLGIKEHTIFPEISAEKVKNIFSFQVNVVSTAKNKEEGMALFKALGFPIKAE